MKNFPKRVKIVEVGPRDGLQNEKEIIPTPLKIELIHRLAETGLQIIEATSFVSPKWIPQLADGDAVMLGISRKKNRHYPVLVPNVMGLNRALAAHTTEIAVFCAASQTFSEKNTHSSIEQNLKHIEAIAAVAKEQKLPIRAYVSCALGCPFEGKVPMQTVVDMAQYLDKIGCNEISISDTIGVGTPSQAQQLIQAILQKIPLEKIAIHFHDTYGQALANIYACLELGVSTIDSAIAGLGGCPYAKGATGNVATEDVVYLLNGLGIETGVDLDALVEVTRFVTSFTKRDPASKVALAMMRK